MQQLIPPSLPDSEEAERIAVLLNPVLWVMTGFTVLAVGVFVWTRVMLGWGIVLAIVILLGVLASHYLAAKGHIHLAAGVICYMVWAVFTEAAIATGILRGPGLSGFIMVVLIGRMLLFSRARTTLYIMSAVSIMGIVVLELAGVLSPIVASNQIWILWVLQVHILIFALGTIYLLNRHYTTIKQKARERQAQLDEIQRAEQSATLTMKNRADALERQVVQLQVAAAVARDATTVRQLDMMLSRAVHLISDRFGFYHAGIFLMDEAGEFAVLRAASGAAGAEMMAAGHMLKVGETGIVGYVTGSGLPRVALDVGEDTVHFKNPMLPETRSELALPLKIGNQVIGALDVQSRKNNAFDSEDVAIFQTMADQLAVAIENARLLEATSRQVEELSVLHSVAEAGAEATSVDGLIERATQVIGETLFPDVFGVVLADDKLGVLKAHPAYRGAEDDLLKRMIPFGEGIIGATYLDGQTRRVADIERDPTAVLGRPGMHAEMCVALKGSERVIGVINTESSNAGAFTAEDERLLGTVARQLSMAIERVQLFETARRRAAELEAIRQAGLHLTANLELQTVLEEILEHAISLVSADYAHIFLYDGVKLTYGAALWSERFQTRIPYMQPRDNGLTYRVARNGEAIVVDDMLTHPLYAGENWEGAVAGLPLRNGDQVIGVMDVSYEKVPHAFTDDELNVLKMLADEAAIGLANARLYSELQAHAQELAEALRQREELVRLKSEFIQNVSHELRTPLAIARGYVDLLDSGDLGDLTDEQKDVIAIVSRRIQMLTRMVDDLTAILEAERLDFDREPVDLAEAVQRLLADFSGTAYQAGLTLATEISPNLPPVLGNATHIQRMLDNLVGNAIKFTPRGGRITVGLRQENGCVMLEVMDTGIGIAEDKLERVFDRFYQVDGSTTRRFGGTGLGLALVKEIVQNHGGEVSVQSNVGKGTTFAVRLPGMEKT